MWRKKIFFFQVWQKSSRKKKLNWNLSTMTVDRDRRKNFFKRIDVRAISALVQLSRAVSKHWHDHKSSNYNGRVPSAKADDRTLSGRTVRGSVDEWRLTAAAAVVFTGCRGGRVHHNDCAAASGRRPWRTMSSMSYLTARTATIARVCVCVCV